MSAYARIPDDTRRALPRHCEECGSRCRLEIHHIDVNPGNPERPNLKVLCKPCHTALHVSLRAPRVQVKKVTYVITGRHLALLRALQLAIAISTGRILSLSVLVRQAIEELARRELDRERFEELMRGAA